MKITITGASGFAGRNLFRYLEGEGNMVQTLSLRDPDWQNRLDTQSHAIIHLAGKAHDTNHTSDPQEYFRVNTGLTRQLFDLFLQNSTRDFIYLSSVKAVADTVDGYLTEDRLPAPRTPYGQSKWEAEQYLNSRILTKEKRLFVFRPCMIHGPGNKGNLNLLYNVAARGIPWPLAAFENKRSFLSIANLQFIVKQVLDNPQIPGGTYNLADDEALSTNELIRIIGESMGRKASMWPISQGVIKGIAKVGDRVKLPLNSERLKKLTESYKVDNTRIKEALGIHALPVSAREGLIYTLKSFQR